MNTDVKSKVNTYRLKFERYAQEAAFVEVAASSLDEAIFASMFIDNDELDWESEDTDPTRPRLYGVQDEDETWLAEVDLSEVLGVPCWTHEDLRRQRNTSETAAALLTKAICDEVAICVQSELAQKILAHLAEDKIAGPSR